MRRILVFWLVSTVVWCQEQQQQLPPTVPQVQPENPQVQAGIPQPEVPEVPQVELPQAKVEIPQAEPPENPQVVENIPQAVPEVPAINPDIPAVVIPQAEVSGAPEVRTYQHPPLTKDNAKGTVVAQNLRFDLNAGERFCLSEHLEVKNQLLVNFRILESDGRSVGLEIIGPTGHLLKELSYDPSANFQSHAEYTGVHQICLRNPNRVSSTRVSLSIYAFDNDKFSAYWEGLVEKEQVVAGLGEILYKVDVNIMRSHHDMLLTSHHSGRDYTLLMQKNTYIWRYSLFQMAIVILIGFIQVRIIRRFFKGVSSEHHGRV